VNSWVDQLTPGPALGRLVEDVLAATTSEDARAVAAAWLADAAAIEAAVARQLAAPGDVEAELVRLEGRPGGARLATRVRSTLRRAARGRPRGSLPDLGELAAALGRDDLPAGLRGPTGWRVDADGITKLKLEGPSGDVEEIPVTRRPMLVTARLEDVASGALSLRLEWKGSTAWLHRVVPRREAFDRKELVGLAAWDAPVTSNNAGDLVDFLSGQEEASRSALPLARVTSSLGWQGGDGGFLWGRTQLLPGGAEADDGPIEALPPARWAPGRVHLLAEHGHASLADAMHPSGTWEGWLAAVEAARPFPVVWLPLYAALVPPLMRFLPTLPNFILDLCGSTSQGKTTSLRLAASAWGSPDERDGGLVRSWDNTRVWIERTAAFLGHLPLLLDDTKRARRAEDVGKTLYDFANGIGRGRGSVDATRSVSTWRSVLLSTGEAPATSFTQDGGTRARTLCVWGSPFGGTSDATVAAVRALTDGVRAHYGHVGPRLVRWLLDTPDSAARVQATYAVHRDTWTTAAGADAVAVRVAQYVAAMGVAADLLHGPLGVPLPEGEPLAHVWSTAEESTADADRASEAVRDVISWAAQHQARFSGRANDVAPFGGYLGAWQEVTGGRRLAILPHALSEVLEAAGYDVDAVVRTWDDRGWTEREDRHRRVKVQVGGEKTRCVVLNARGLAVVDGGAP
jgi:putative DNA primase/helicase